jgi:hypothetical protein
MTDSDNLSKPTFEEKLSLKASQLRRALQDKNYPQSTDAHLGVWIALLGKEDYQESCPHAALSARRLMECAALEITGLQPEKNPGDMANEVKKLKESLSKASPSEIDSKWVVSLSFAGDLQTFFDSFDKRQTRNQRMQEMLMKADPSGIPIPEEVRGLMASDWVSLYGYFSNTLHFSYSQEIKREELIQKIEKLEQLLLEYILYAGAVENLDEIDDLIEETEAV